MKKFAGIIVAVLLAFSLVGCGSVDSVLQNLSGMTSGGSDDGYVEGRMGDVMNTYFFDYSVNSAYTCYNYEGYTPSSGNKLLVAEVTVKNTDRSTITMYDVDFQVQWGDDDNDDAFDTPITYYGNTVSDEQLPEEYDLGVNEERTGLLVFEVPEDSKDYSISYLEQFSNDTEGDVFFVYFTADNREDTEETQSTKIENIEEIKAEEAEAIANSQNTEKREDKWSDYPIITNFPNETDDFDEKILGQLDKWRRYVKKIAATYDAIDEICATKLGTATFEHMSADNESDYPPVTDFIEIKTEGGYSPEDYAIVAAIKYIDLYVNEGKRDLNYREILEGLTYDEVAIDYADMDVVAGLWHIYYGYSDEDFEAEIKPEFNPIIDLKDYQGTYGKGRTWEITDSDDEMFYNGTDYIYSFYNHGVADNTSDHDRGLLWLFDKDGNLLAIEDIRGIYE